MRARVAFAAVAALLVTATPATASAARCARAQVAPPPAAPATDAQVSAYLHRLDRASMRVVSGTFGRSVDGRALPYAVVSAPANLAHLPSISAALRGVRDGSGAPAAARRAVHDGPAIVWLAGGVHGNEPSGTDADLRVARRLAAGGAGGACALLRRLVVVVVPLQNPDGRAAGTRVNANGFDLNRDWLADSQPETAARLALLARYPPIALDDQHEQDGTAVSTPPNARPILPVLPAQALRALRDRYAPALRRALHPTGRAFDLLFPGYGDSGATALAGAAGMTIEVGSAAPYATRMAEHATAAWTILRVAAAHRAALLAGWAAARRAAAAAPARTYLLAPGAAAATLVARLQAGGVAVGRLPAATPLAAFHPFGAPAPTPAVLPAGTWTVSDAQPSRAWVQALLEENAGRGARSLYDDTSWSQSLLAGAPGGWTDSPLPTLACGGSGAEGCGGAGAAPEPAAAYAFAGDDLGGLGLAADLLARGATVQRTPVTGALTVTGVDPATLAALAAARRVTVQGAAAAAPAPSATLREPHIALLDDLVPTVTGPPGQEDSGRHESRAWTRFLLRDRLHLDVTDLAPTALAAGVPAGTTALVVADGAGALGPAALAAVRAFAEGGGTVVAIGALGLATAQAAQLTPVATAPAPQLQSDGATFAVTLDPTDPLAWGAGTTGFVLDVADDVLDPATATAPGTVVVARHPTPPRLLAGSARGLGALAGSPVLLDQPVGAGRLALFAFDPAYRAYVDGESRLLVNALLAPPASAGARRSASSRRSALRR